MSGLEVSVAGYTADKTGNMHRIKTKRWQNEIEATNVKLTVVINRTHLLYVLVELQHDMMLS